jgi:hypothetical protein
VRRVLWTVAAVVVLAAGATWGGLAWHHHATYGTVVREDQKTLTVDRGDRFSIGVRDHGPSVGDHWTVETTAGDTLSAVGQRHVSFDLLERVGINIETAGGGDGITYFRYDARRSGTAAVTLSNCFQGCHWPSPYTRSVTWMITIR